MPFIIALIGLFMCLSTPADAQDVFTDFENGAWGYPRDQEPSCRNNPHTIRFSQDRTHAEFAWFGPMTTYLRQQKSSAGYTVISHGSDRIVMAMDEETRLTPQGDLVVWVLITLPNDMYCWGRTDWPSTGCLAIHVRCPELPPIS